MTQLPPIQIQPRAERRVRDGHPWVFSNEIRMDDTARSVPLGGLVRLETVKGEAIAVAGFNRHALIAARVLSLDPTAAIDGAFLERRLAAALALRQRLFDRPFYRLVFAEADGLPGLVVDRYGDVVAVQANTALMDRLLPELVAALDRLLAPAAIVLRNDSSTRALEGLDQHVRLAKGALSGPVELEENGARYLAEPTEGQKTGWFFDQRDNRAFAARLARGQTVLDGYSHTGGFAILAALGGASRVVAVDRSEPALALAMAAAKLNGVADRIEPRRAEMFEELARLARERQRFGLVVVDPPAFVKSKKDLAAGLAGYRKLARLSAQLVAPGGYLLIASCSHQVGPELFLETVARGLVEAHRQGRILRQSGAAPDHPIHPHLPESSYLKALALQLD